MTTDTDLEETKTEARKKEGQIQMLKKQEDPANQETLKHHTRQHYPLLVGPNLLHHHLNNNVISWPDHSSTISLS
jgi:uncharacterized membrane protein YcaP (DUF421 family)